MKEKSNSSKFTIKCPKCNSHFFRKKFMIHLMKNHKMTYEECLIIIEDVHGSKGVNTYMGSNYVYGETDT